MLHFKDPGSGEVLFLCRLREASGVALGGSCGFCQTAWEKERTHDLHFKCCRCCIRRSGCSSDAICLCRQIQPLATLGAVLAVARAGPYSALLSGRPSDLGVSAKELLDLNATPCGVFVVPHGRIHPYTYCVYACIYVHIHLWYTYIIHIYIHTLKIAATHVYVCSAATYTYATYLRVDTYVHIHTAVGLHVLICTRILSLVFVLTVPLCSLSCSYVCISM